MSYSGTLLKPVRFAFCVAVTSLNLLAQSGSLQPALSQQILSQATEKLPGFDVASIRLSDMDSHEGHLQTDDRTLTFENISLDFCIRWAYDIQPYQLSGPGWLREERVDIRAKAAENADADRMRLMLRSLLAERFDLKLHHEQKELPVFLLTLAKNGPKLHAAGSNGSKFVKSTAEGPSSFNEDKTGLSAQNFDLSEMAAKLSRPLKRPVIDKTGLGGRFDMRVDVSGYVEAGNGDSDGKDHLDPISVVQGAFQEQLGLKLQADRAVVDFVVVDSMNRSPSEN